jgi:ferritin-like metal-binding protein YciE
MEGLIDEGKEIISENEDTPGLDAALICAAQKVEHYEMASYGSLRAWAQAFGNEQAARLLQETLNEEEMADEKLNQIAQRSNRTAVEAMA